MMISIKTIKAMAFLVIAGTTIAQEFGDVADFDVLVEDETFWGRSLQESSMSIPATPPPEPSPRPPSPPVPTQTQPTEARASPPTAVPVTPVLVIPPTPGPVVPPTPAPVTIAPVVTPTQAPLTVSYIVASCTYLFENVSNSQLALQLITLPQNHLLNLDVTTGCTSVCAD
jgi:hypothetical protein